MVYYHIPLSEEARNFSTIILPWVKYKYKFLHEMFHGIEFTRAYIDDPLIITKGNWSDHLNKLELVIKKLGVNGLKPNIKK